MGKQYRIYTEDVNLEGIQGIVEKYFGNYTLISGSGIWQGHIENSLVIEIIELKAGPDHDYYVREICEKIKVLNKQEAVLFVCFEVRGLLV